MRHPDTRFYLQIDAQNKSFDLSASVFEGSAEFPKLTAAVFSNSSQLHFREEDGEIFLHVKVPLASAPKRGFRNELYGFLRKAQACRKYMKRIAHLELLQDARAIYTRSS